ncbi:hypothetical protein KCP73_26130 [Salmonella enterica subsp. enterica]|nr:hypothetical protein KCP73_26130 [Salmonella enterica subsp. enterica]
MFSTRLGGLARALRGFRFDVILHYTREMTTKRRQLKMPVWRLANPAAHFGATILPRQRGFLTMLLVRKLMVTL